MNCRQAGRLAATGGGTGNPEFERHLAACEQCRWLAGVILNLEHLGALQRRTELPQAAIRDTELRAAAILAAGRKRADVPDVLFPWLLLRPLAATLAAASILIAVISFAWTQAELRRPCGTITLTTREVAAMDARIALLAERVDARLKGFVDKHRDSKGAGSLETLSAALRNDIAARSMEVRRELQ